MTFKVDKNRGPAVGWGMGHVPGGIKDQHSMVRLYLCCQKLCHFFALIFNKFCSLCAQDERNGYLRIAMTSREQIECILPNSREGNIWIMPWSWCEWRAMANATSQLTVLCLPDGENKRLEEVATVKDLGMTEEIKSVQFFDDQLFIVTFQRMDPLYAIDLKNPEKPVLAGELKIRVRLSEEMEQLLFYAVQSRLDKTQ